MIGIYDIIRTKICEFLFLVIVGLFVEHYSFLIGSCFAEMALSVLRNHKLLSLLGFSTCAGALAMTNDKWRWQLDMEVDG